MAIYGLLFAFYRPNLLFSATTTAGGDTGAHHYQAQYLIQELLPHFKLTGWAPGWYAGMPMLTFYFPFPFLLIAILSWILPYTVAFKIITALGVFALPACAYAFGRLLRLRRPYPIMAAIFVVGMLLMESYSIYGGNIKSTLAGEFGYMLSFSLVFLFLGTMWRGMEKPGFNMLFVLNCLILMAIILSHVVTTIVLVALLPGLLLVHPRVRALGYMVAVGLIGFCLTAFWTLPFIVDLKWSAHDIWYRLHSFHDLVPNGLLPIAALALIGMAYAVAKRERKILPLAWITVITLIMFWVIPNGRLWNGRVVPFFYMSLHLWAAYGAAWLVRPFAVVVRDLFQLRGVNARRIYIPVVAVAIMAILGTTSTTAASWIKWNYSGYEGKTTWPQYQQIMNFLDTLSPGERARVMVEHSTGINDFGTERAFEIIPYWTHLDTMEGTVMEASFTAPFHFVNLGELSKDQGGGGSTLGLPAYSMDVPLGITHLQLMNIEYMIAVTDEVKSQLREDPRVQELATFGDYSIFQISGETGYVEVMKNEPVKVDIPVDQWRDMALQWYTSETALDTPIVLDNGDPALRQFKTITPSEAASPPVTPITTEGHVTSETLENESLTFDTTAIGVPHYIKISYFPNWHVKGAEGPFLVSPSLMMVIPTQQHVVLYYGSTPANTIGHMFEILGWIVVLGIIGWRTVIWFRRRRLSGAVQGSGALLLSGRDDHAADYDDEAGEIEPFGGTGIPDSQGTPVWHRPQP